MYVLSIQEFNAQCSEKVDSSEKIYEGKTIARGPVFPLTDVEAARSYCNIFNSKQTEKICLIVKDKSFLRIWTEADAIENRESDDNLSSSERKASERTLPIEIEFTNNCQALLAQYIGPIAQIICKKTLAKKQNLTREEFVEILAKQISDSQQAREFKQRLLE